MKFKSFLLIITLFFNASLFPFSLKVDTLKIEKTLAPGEVCEGVITVINTDEQPKGISAGMLDYVYDGQSQKVAIKPFNTQKNSASSWIQLMETKVNVPPKSSYALQYSITVPPLEELEYSEYMAIIYVESFAEKPDLATSFLMASKARMLITTRIRIDGKIDLKGEVTDFKATPATDEDPFRMYYSFKNTGNAINRIDGSFSIIDDEGNLYGRGTLNHSYANPGETIEKKSIWEGDLDPGEYDLIAEIKYEPDQIDIQEYHFSVKEEKEEEE